MTIAWRIYYADGSTFDSAQGGPEDAVPTGVICIKQRNKMHGAVTYSGRGYYLWQEGSGEWWPSDAVGFWQYMFKPGHKVALFGENVTDEMFHEIMRCASLDTDFQKNARSPVEAVE